MARTTHREIQPAYQRLGKLPAQSGIRLNDREESLIGFYNDAGEAIVPRDWCVIPALS